MINSSSRRAEALALCLGLVAAGCRTLPLPAAPAAAPVAVPAGPETAEEPGGEVRESAADTRAPAADAHPDDAAAPAEGAEAGDPGATLPAAAGRDAGNTERAAAPGASFAAIASSAPPAPAQQPPPSPAAPPLPVPSGGGGGGGQAASSRRAAGLELTLVAAPADPRVGDSLTLEVRADTTARIVDAPFTVAYDPAVLRYTGAEAGPFLQADGGAVVFLANGTARPGRVVIGVGRGDRGRGLSGSGLLCRLRFEVLRPGDAGVQVAEMLAWGDDGRAVPVAARPFSLVAGGGL